MWIHTTYKLQFEVWLRLRYEQTQFLIFPSFKTSPFVSWGFFLVTCRFFDIFLHFTMCPASKIFFSSNINFLWAEFSPAQSLILCNEIYILLKNCILRYVLVIVREVLRYHIGWLYMACTAYMLDPNSYRHPIEESHGGVAFKICQLKYS